MPVSLTSPSSLLKLRIILLSKRERQGGYRQLQKTVTCQFNVDLIAIIHDPKDLPKFT